MAQVTVTRADPTQAREAAAVLAAAFRDDPVMRAVIPRDAEPQSALAELFTATLSAGAFATGAVDIARVDDDPRIVGVAAWEGPRGVRGALVRQVRHLPAFVRALGWRGLGRAAGIQHRLDRRRPTFPHWYLAEVGVLPAGRGAGVGAALLTARLARLDADEQTAYLESSTPENRRLYRRLGFREAGAIEGIPGAAPARMLRAPRAATAT